MVRFVALETDVARALQSGGPDAYGQSPERQISTGDGDFCRHCLRRVAQGEPFLILSYRPFPAPQPYAEQGPIFLHAEKCQRYRGNGGVPGMLSSPGYILRGYDAANRIVYGTGRIVATSGIPSAAAETFTDPRVAYIHVRSAANNCYQCRIERD